MNMMNALSLDNILVVLLLMFIGESCFSEELVNKQVDNVISNNTNHSQQMDQSRFEAQDVPILEIFPSFHTVQSTEDTDGEKDEIELKMQSFSKAKTFLEIVTEKYHGFTWANTKLPAKGKPESICLPRSLIDDNSTREVQLVNSTTLLGILGNKSNSLGHCNVVLFFAPWCMFCSKIAPFYNALAGAFPQLNVLAIEAAQFSSLNTRYGTIAVPNILVFYNNSKGVARFNHSDRTFETFVGFVQNVTGFKPNESMTVRVEDFDGPLSSTWSKDNDWLLWLSWIFVIVFFVTAFAKSNIGQHLINMVMNFGVEHHHID